MPISNEELAILKKPFGKLISKNQVNREKVLENLRNVKEIITVGDATTEKILSYGIIPKISIIDNIERRKRKKDSIKKIIQHYKEHKKDDQILKEYRCKNPAGGITKEAYMLIKKLINIDEFAIIIVDGEEDLLALPVFCLVPNNTVIMYGQPLEGLVIVRINDKIRSKAQILLNSMKLK